ncbi:hypothetical protein A2635_02320 [Candidatus Peribacteria bacterium RIFCSPHIGHO2_01_FULL_51_9]|nr:MAG: hypothetical protein A2635_02320 [Candidatus Peribacteria bacterium RIFCSPHIGHO2_01_FULL_51_9]
MKMVAVYFDDPDFDDYPFDIDLYRKVYHQLGQVMEDRGGQLSIVRSQKTFLGHGKFSHAWTYEAGAFVYSDMPKTFDVVWNKGEFLPDADTMTVNDPRLTAITGDKWVSEQWFPEIHAPTVLLQNSDDMKKAMQVIGTDRIVLKPLMGYGGEGVVVMDKEEWGNAPPVFPCIAQEFIDTSRGIPGLVDGMHDFRVIVMDGEIVLSYIRTPPPHKFTANVSQGGREIEVMRDMVPSAVEEIVAVVEKKFRQFPHRLYTIDMGLDVSGRWEVFELNARPGFSPMETGKSYPPFYERLCDFLLSIHKSGASGGATASSSSSPSSSISSSSRSDSQVQPLPQPQL